MEQEACTSAQLIHRAGQGDADAFAALSAKYLWLVRLKAQHFTGTAVPEREDLIQEGLLGLYVAAASYDEAAGASFATYAGVCIYNRMVSAARRYASNGNRTLNESVSLDSGEAISVQAGKDPMDVVELRERLGQLKGQLQAGLSPLERRVLSLYLTGCRRRELPRRLGISQKSCDNALHRVRSKLRAMGGAGQP